MQQKTKKHATKSELVKRYMIIWGILMVILFATLHFFILKGNIILEIFISMNIGAFFLFGLDKIWATHENSPRLPERFFFWVAFLGGALAILIGSNVFRHKRQKMSFMWRIFVALFLHFGLLAYVFRDLFQVF